MIGLNHKKFGFIVNIVEYKLANNIRISGLVEENLLEEGHLSRKVPIETRTDSRYHN